MWCVARVTCLAFLITLCIYDFTLDTSLSSDIGNFMGAFFVKQP